MPHASEDDFARASIQEVPHLLFPFAPSHPKSPAEEFAVEFPHFHTRTNQKVLDMFGVAELY